MSNDYDENQIQILEGLEAVRKRPGMYIGTTSSRGLHQLAYEIIDNAVDEALGGFATEIEVVINKDNSLSVKDNGRGIPIGIHPEKNIPAVEVVFTLLHAGGKFGGEGSMYKVSGGLHGVGASVVNALSEWLVVNIYTNNKIYQQKFSRGDTTENLTEIGSTDFQGTLVTFKPDYQIFEILEFEFDILKQKVQETAFLTKGLKLSLTDLRGEEEKFVEYHYEGGIKEFVQYINRNKTPITESIFYAEGSKDDIYVEVAFQYNDGYVENTFAFVNNINTIEGGTHLAGYRTALTKTINNYAQKYNYLKDGDKNFSGDDVREGITTILSLKIIEPQFEGQTKTKLGNSDARGAVDSILSEQLEYYLEENPSIAKIIIEKGLMASRARSAAKKARELVRRKSVLESGRLPGKLADCSDKNPENCEIYIVEGDSAGGTAKSARTRETQAILPLRGKVLNVEKSRMDKVLANAEIRMMITAFGTGIFEDFEIEDLRYHKIIIMTDADVDGAHIRTLLLTFLYRYMKPLIENGFIYIAQPPLYRVSKRRSQDTIYAYSDAELEAVYAEIGREGTDLQRYKGLGEMNADQLWDTTMNPETRTLLRVTLEDVIAADDIFTRLMGDKVEPRREFINEYGKDARYIDV